MDCFQCNFDYDNEERLPKILTTCGHTLCQACICISFINNTVVCPQCNTHNSGDSVSKFPVNLALLAVRTSVVKDSPPNLCEKHSRALEAYCTTDNSLLCISCILEDRHKSHEITSTAKAATKHRAALSALEVLVLSTEETILKEQECIEKLTRTTAKGWAKLQGDYSKTFAFLRETLNTMEQALVCRISESYKTEISYLKQREKLVSQYLSVIADFKHEKSTAEAEDGLSVVKYFGTRENLGRKACTRLVAFSRADPFSSFTKESESTVLIKAFTAALQPPLHKERSTRRTLNLLSKPAQSPGLEPLFQPHSSRIYTIAGCAERSLSSVEQYNFHSNSWQRAPDCLHCRSQFSAVILENTILVLGGKQGGERLSNSELFDTQDGAWVKSEYSLTAPRSGFAAVAQSPLLYVFGGSDGAPLSRFEQWNEREWLQLPSLRSRRAELAGCLGPDNRIYALGGTNSRCLSSCEVFA